jgi:hypothetical protein
MSEEIQLPPLPEGYKWEEQSQMICCRGPNAGICLTTDKFDNRVEVWKRVPNGHSHWEAYPTTETLQQALNMAAALVALGEADE